MNSSFFILILFEFMIGTYLTKRRMNCNRGNVVNLPIWRKAVENSLDGILFSFALYFIVNRPDDRECAMRMTVILFLIFGTLAVFGFLYNMLQGRKRGGSRVNLGLAWNLELLPEVKRTWYTPELEYIKCTIIYFYKVLLVFWVLLYLLGEYILRGAYCLEQPDLTTQIFLERFMLVLTVLSLCCVIDNLLAIIINRDNQSRSIEMEKIHQKLSARNKRV